MAIDWSKIFERYKGLWVAFESDEETVIASGRTVKEVVDDAAKKGKKDPIVARIPAELVDYVGGGLQSV